MPAQLAPVESLNVGDIRITYLPDGDARMAPTVVFGSSDQALWDAHQEYLDEDGNLLASIGGFLIETGERKLLVDLGFGDVVAPFPPVGTFRGGRFLDSLKQTGVAPAEIDTVVFTHLHLDHVGWTTRAGALCFPNAAHLAGAGEWDFWRGVTDAGLAAVGPDPEAVQAHLVERIDGVGDGAAIAPGVTALATPGHTPGHISVVVSSGTDRAIIMGDTAHCPLQFDEADLAVMFDVDPALARRTRERITAELESEGTIGADGHFAGTVFGRLMPGAGKRWAQV